MAKTIVNNNIKLKSGGGVLNDPTDGLSVDTTLYPLNAISFPSITSTAIIGQQLAASKLYQLATSTTTATAQSTTNSTDYPNRPNIHSGNWMFIPFDNSSDFTRMVSFIATIYSVTAAGTLTLKVYRLASVWDNTDPATTLSGAVEVGSGTLVVGTTGGIVVTFSSPVIVDVKHYLYAFRFSTSDANITFTSPETGSGYVGHRYKAFFSSDSGSSWSAGNYYISDYNINVNPMVIDFVYPASTTVVDGIVTGVSGNGYIGDTANIQSAGLTTLAGAVAGKMYYSDGSGAITPTPDGTKVSVGVGTDTNKLLIIKGVK